MTSPFAARPTAVVLDPTARVPAAAPRAVDPVPPVGPEEGGPTGYVVFELSGEAYAVPVEQVGSVLRGGSARARPQGDDGLVLVDVRGRTVPALDRRTDRSGPGDVLVPHLRRHAGLVVDRVLAVRAGAELVAEPGDDACAAVPGVRAVLRPVEDGPAVLLVGMPENAVG